MPSANWHTGRVAQIIDLSKGILLEIEIGVEKTIKVEARLDVRDLSIKI